MMDERTQSDGAQPDRFDDDRLLAFALGLDDDPELRAAAAADARLGERLAAMRADVADVGAQVRAAVPPPDEVYADLSGERWGGLREYFEVRPGTGETRSGAGDARGAARAPRRWWRLAVPLTALAILALVAGFVAVNQGGIGSSDSSGESTVAVDGSGTGERAGSSDSGQDSAGGGEPSPQTLPESAPQTAAQRIAAQLDRFAIVVLGRAREATGALQRFAVVRIFKGDAPEVVELEVGDEPTDPGRLHLLMLDPTTAASEWPEQPEPSATFGPAEDDASYGRPLPASYTYKGEPAAVREFAAGTDPASVELPLP